LLQASRADSIYAYGYAYSNDGYAADYLHTTSVRGQAQASYFNYAYATPSYAYDYAVVGSASGNYASAQSYAGNWDWGDYASNSIYASSASSSNYPSMIWNVAQTASSTYTHASAGTTGGNAWSTDGYTGQSSYASDYWGDYSYSYLYSPYGLTKATSSYQPDNAYASGSNRYTWTSESAYLYGYPTYAYSVNYNAYTGLYKSDSDYYYGWNYLSHYAYNSYRDSYALNFQY